MTEEQIKAKAKEQFPNDEFRQQAVIDAINWATKELEKENAELKLKLEALEGQTPWKDIKDKSEVIGKLTKNSYYVEGFKDGYNKANEWHFVKDGDYPKDKGNYLVAWKRTHHVEEYGKWGFDVDLFNADEGYFEGVGDYVIAWQEIVLPELKESE